MGARKAGNGNDEATEYGVRESEEKLMKNDQQTGTDQRYRVHGGGEQKHR